jgi:hypothetical protein
MTETRQSPIFTTLGKMIGLPDEFLTNKKGSKGGGVIQVTFYFIYLVAKSVNLAVFVFRRCKNAKSISFFARFLRIYEARSL